MCIRDRTIAVRFPSHRLTRSLLKVLKYPLAAPSANLSKQISPVSKSDVIEEFGKKIKFVLDGGQSKVGVESTIVNLIGKPKILRLGGIERKSIEKFFINRNKTKYKKKKIVVPGQGKVHYSPGVPIRLNVKHPKNNEAYILIKERKYSKDNFYYLSKKKNLKEAAKNFYYLSKKKNLKEAAKKLYKTLRMIKKDNFKSIAVEKIPNIGFGETINDRLIRASK